MTPAWQGEARSHPGVSSDVAGTVSTLGKVANPMTPHPASGHPPSWLRPRCPGACPQAEWSLHQGRALSLHTFPRGKARSCLHPLVGQSRPLSSHLPQKLVARFVPPTPSHGHDTQTPGYFRFYRTVLEIYRNRGERSIHTTTQIKPFFLFWGVFLRLFSRFFSFFFSLTQS